jgi:hypothetical protein
VALSRIKEWRRNEVLLSTDLNAEFDNIIDNAGDATFPLQSDLEVGSKLLINTGLQNPLQLHDAIHAIEGKYSSSLPVAVASIGTSRITLLIGSVITLGSNLSIPDNVFLWPVGPGKIFVNSGVTLTIASPSQIMAGTNQQIFDGTGTVSFTNSGIVSKGWWGFSTSATASENQGRGQAAYDSLPSPDGGAIAITPGRYSHTGPFTAGNKAISLIGAHPDMCILSNTADASLQHGLVFTRSHHVRNLTLKTSSNLTANRQMKAIDFDLNGISVSGGNLAAVYEHIKIRGYNIGIYGDGDGTNYNVDRTLLRDIDIQVSGDGTSYIGSAIYQNNMNQVLIQHVQIDQNDTGEHAIYCLGNKNFILDGAKIRNATKNEAQAIKLIGNTLIGTSIYKTWNIRNVDIDNCTNGILLQIYDSETLDSLLVENATLVDVDCTANIQAAIWCQSRDTSTIRQVKVDNCSFRDIGRGCVMFGAEDTAAFNHGVVMNCRALNWSTASSGTYAFFLTDGDGTYGSMVLDNIEADGNNNGRTILATAGQSNPVLDGTSGQITYRNLVETRTTSYGRPIELGQDDTTPALNIGRRFQFNNSNGSHTVTRFDAVIKGEEYVLGFSNGNTTIQNGARIFLAGGSNFVGSSHDFLRLLCTDDTAGSTIMKELSRSVN